MSNVYLSTVHSIIGGRLFDLCGLQQCHYPLNTHMYVTFLVKRCFI